MSGFLTKTTLAYQITKGRGYYIRPTIRFFVTQAAWSNGFKGAIAGSTYADKTSGWTAGVQTEAWW